METIEVVIYTFDELEDEAKEKARTWYRDGLEYPWFSEAIDSIRAFVKHFGAELKDWQIGGGSGRDYIKTDATNENFRGVKLKNIDKDYTPTKKRKFSTSKSKIKGGSYTIKQGDSLSAIAKRNGTTVAKLKAANGLKSDLIRAGKTLKIPR